MEPGFFWVGDESVKNSSLGSEFERCIATGLITPAIDVSSNSSLVKAVPESGSLAFEDSVETECDCLLEELNRYEIENKQLKKLIWEIDAVVKAISTCL